MSGPSVLFNGPDAGAAPVLAEHSTFSDLQLDRVRAQLTRGHEGCGLETYFGIALQSVAAVRYRQAVLAELEHERLRDAVTVFADAMNGVRHLRQASVEDERDTAEAFQLLAAASAYCRAARQITDSLAGCGSAGLARMHAYLRRYIDSATFTALEAEAADLETAISAIRYQLHIEGGRVSVSPHRPGEDYSNEVAAAFERFRPETDTVAPPITYEVDELSSVETQILRAVMRLFPEPFARRARFAASNRDFPDETVMRFAREVRFYLAYLELIAPVRAAGLAFCYPQVELEPDPIVVEGTFDLAVACKRAVSGDPVITNDFQLDGAERIIVVTGPNNGGKTTFARTFGQLHHLARLGLCVPGRAACLPLADRILTHFEREEDSTTRESTFDGELLRAQEALSSATARSVIVMNESFSATSLTDARFVGAEILSQITELGCLAVYVTFVDELATLGPATVSMVAQVMPEDASRRTFRILRQPPTGLAYTRGIAEKYGISYDRLMERIDG